MTTNRAAEIFEAHRSRLLAIANRMLGTRCDAEDLVQDAYLRWHQTATQEIECPVAFLVTITKRLCLDRLRELKQQPIQYVDSSISEAIVEDHAPSPEEQLASKEELAAGFLIVLERLGPAERAAFLLHDLFDYEYREVAQILRRSEESCRQTLHRARKCLREARARFTVTPQSAEHQRALKRFLVAVATGDRHAVAALLATMGIGSRTDVAVDADLAIVQVREAANDAMLDAALAGRQ
jgi:RNA polymerase sigma-70 factor, ECF subfamily